MIIDILLLPFTIIISIIAGHYIAKREAKKCRKKRINALLDKKDLPTRSN
jgi:uncharacterized protein YneF (UPF0154 family)